jgi:hypothetical protein
MKVREHQRKLYANKKISLLLYNRHMHTHVRPCPQGEKNRNTQKACLSYKAFKGRRKHNIHISKCLEPFDLVKRHCN